jgi:hypothetical protein
LSATDKAMWLPWQTRTPSGVDFARKLPEYLSVGDVMEAEIERMGVLRNAVTTAPADGAVEEASALMLTDVSARRVEVRSAEGPAQA